MKKMNAIEQIIDTLLEYGFEPIGTDDYKDNFCIILEKGSDLITAQLPFQFIPTKTQKEIDTSEGYYFKKRDESLPIYLNICNKEEKMELVLHIDYWGEQLEEEFLIPSECAQKILSHFRYHLFAYNKTLRRRYLCGITKEKAEMSILLNYAKEETKSFPEINGFIILDTKTKKEENHCLYQK